MVTTAPDLKFSGTFTANGGVLYDVIIAGDAKNSQLIVAATGLSEAPGSAPVGTPVPVAVAPTATSAVSVVVVATTEPPQPIAPTATAFVVVTATPADVVPAATPQPTIAVVVPATATQPPPPPTPEPIAQLPTATSAPVDVPPTAVPIASGSTGIVATVETDPGVNLKLREYPVAESRTLALMPSGATVDVIGVGVPALLPGTPTPVAVPTLSAEGVQIENLWIFVSWPQPDGGTITGWTKPQYLAITNAKGQRVFSVAGILALPQVPDNEFGVIRTGAATPVPPTTENIIGTVVVDAGVNLQIRRLPDINSESLALVPSGTQLIVLEKTEVKSLGGLVGEPQNLIWLYIRYQTDTGSVTGWVNSQFIILTRKGQPWDIKEIPVATEIQVGGLQGSFASAGPEIPKGLVAVVDKVNEGVNLQLRREANANAESLGLIPKGTILKVLGRNGTGTWLQVEISDRQGWINALYVTVRKDGKIVDIMRDVKNVTEEVDATLTPTPTSTPRP